jgi:hypothetical protein
MSQAARRVPCAARGALHGARSRPHAAWSYVRAARRAVHDESMDRSIGRTHGISASGPPPSRCVSFDVKRMSAAASAPTNGAHLPQYHMIYNA